MRNSRDACKRQNNFDSYPQSKRLDMWPECKLGIYIVNPTELILQELMCSNIT